MPSSSTAPSGSWKRARWAWRGRRPRPHTRSAMARAPGPDSRTTPIPPAPVAVATATMVSAAVSLAACMAPMLARRRPLSGRHRARLPLGRLRWFGRALGLVGPGRIAAVLAQEPPLLGQAKRAVGHPVQHQAGREEDHDRTED